MKTIVLFTLVVIATTVNVKGKGHSEVGLMVAPGFQFGRNMATISDGVDANLFRSHSTFAGLGAISYFRIFESGMQVGLLGGFGYSRYSFDINFPFQEFGFLSPSNTNQYSIRSNVFYSSLSLILGYRFLKYGFITPELSYAQNIRLPLKSDRVTYTTVEKSLDNNEVQTLSVDYAFGRRSTDLNVEFTNSFYFGVRLTGIRQLSRVHLGLQFDHQLYSAGPRNYINAFYKDAYGNWRGSSSWSPKLQALSLIIRFDISE